MSKSSTRLIDNYIVYRFMSFIIFFIFIILQFSAVEVNKTPIFPNPFSIIVFFAILFILTTISQIVEPINFERDWLLKRNLLAAIPPFLGFILSVRFYKEEKKEKRDGIFELMAIVSIVIMGFFTLTLILFLILLYVFGSVESLSFYFMTVGLWGMLGITIGDSNILYKSEINISQHKTMTSLQTLQKNSSLFISKLFSTSRRRFIWIFIILITLYLFMIITNSTGVDPIYI